MSSGVLSSNKQSTVMIRKIFAADPIYYSRYIDSRIVLLLPLLKTITPRLARKINLSMWFGKCSNVGTTNRPVVQSYSSPIYRPDYVKVQEPRFGFITPELACNAVQVIIFIRYLNGPCSTFRLVRDGWLNQLDQCLNRVSQLGLTVQIHHIIQLLFCCKPTLLLLKI